MRKRRSILFSRDQEQLNAMTYYLGVRGGYDVLTYREPVFCPVWANNADCLNSSPCADIIIADLAMVKMTGMELFQSQSERGCKVSRENKAFIAGRFDDMKIKETMTSGYVVFDEPIDFQKMSIWLLAREDHMDLSRPLKITRKEERFESNREVACIAQPNNRFLRGIAVNMSSSGLCLKSHTPLRQEQVVTIHPDYLIPPQAASVRWTVKTESGAYMMGLQYMET